MESVLSKIIEIDRMADKKISDAQISSEKKLRDTEMQCRIIKNNLMADADKRINEVERINKTDFEDRVDGLAEKYSGEKKEMDSFFKNMHAEIEDKIFAEIVGE